MDMKTILAVDDDRAALDTFKVILGNRYNMLLASNGMDALNTLGECDVDLVLLDILLPGMDGTKVLSEIKKRFLGVPVIMVTGLSTIEMAVRTVKIGAYEYLTKPFEAQTLERMVRDVLNDNGREGSSPPMRYDFSEIVGNTQRMREVLDFIKQVSNSSSTVLIQGETGTGKELVARAIHNNSSRRNGSFIVFDCAGVNANLVESALFGHEKGAFTGATSKRIGVFEQADRGTLFLDEVGALDYDLQDKLLRVLEGREFTRIGGDSPIKVDVRIIAASNRDLEEAVRVCEFRGDLYHRINVVSISLPPLKERLEDIPYLVCHFHEKLKKTRGGEAMVFSEEAIRALCKYDWPGNVRELKNTIERLLVTVRDDVIRAYHVDTAIKRNKKEIGHIGYTTFEDVISEVERFYLEKALLKAKGNKTEAARILGTTYRVVKYKTEQIGVDYRKLLYQNKDTEEILKEKMKRLKRIVE